MAFDNRNTYSGSFGDPNAYSEYINSLRWQGVRQQAFMKRGRRCEACPSCVKLHVHHVFYPLDVRDTRVDHVMALCEHCHQTLHEVYGNRSYTSDESRIEETRQWIKSVYPFKEKPLPRPHPQSTQAQQPQQCKNRKKKHRNKNKPIKGQSKHWTSMGCRIGGNRKRRR